jgi:anthranilate synthase component 2
MILLIDNYDSFVYNLYHLIGVYYDDIKVIRNNEMSVEDIKKLNPKAIALSPGPGRPHDAGVIEDVIEEFHDKVPMLGICLGHQAIIETFGGKIVHALKCMHGKTSTIILHENPLFEGLPSTLNVARYHSLVGKDIPETLDVIALSEEGEVMAVKHKKYPVYGLQFHPESIMSEGGKVIIQNFLKEISK